MRFIRSWFETKHSTTSQSTGINGDGNQVDQSVNTTVVIVEGDRPINVPEVSAKHESPLIKRALTAGALAQAARNNERPVTVFLAGPFITPEVEVDSKSSAAAKLRYELFHRLKSEGFVVSLGTYPDLVASFEAGTEGYHNSAEAELDHAKGVASLVVMIPDSPGSFAEIGAFSLKKEICGKMIILADRAREKNLGYLNTGPIACAEVFGSSVERVDYKDVDACFKIVSAFSHKVKNQIQLQSRLDR